MNRSNTRTLGCPEARAPQCGMFASGDAGLMPASARQRRARAGPGASLRRSALRADAPAMLGLVARRGTHYATCDRCVRPTATSLMLKRAARAATSPALLGASQARPILPEPTFAGAVWAFQANRSVVASRRAASGRGDFWGGEKASQDTNSPVDCSCLASGQAAWPGAACKASPGVGARSALRELTRRGWSNAATAGRVVSSAARPRGEHHSGVGAKRRPTQHEPVAGAACRDAHKPRICQRERTGKTGRVAPLVDMTLNS